MLGENDACRDQSRHRILGKTGIAVAYVSRTLAYESLCEKGRRQEKEERAYYNNNNNNNNHTRNRIIPLAARWLHYFLPLLSSRYVLL